MTHVQVTLDEPLAARVERAIADMRTTPSKFFRAAALLALAQHETARLERLHREGYARYPQQQEDVAEWDDVRVWGDE